MYKHLVKCIYTPILLLYNGRYSVMLYLRVCALRYYEPNASEMSPIPRTLPFYLDFTFFLPDLPSYINDNNNDYYFY